MCAYGSVFKKGEPFKNILHMPQSKLYMNCTKNLGIVNTYGSCIYGCSIFGAHF